jgi:hypothetical protein
VSVLLHEIVEICPIEFLAAPELALSAPDNGAL